MTKITIPVPMYEGAHLEIDDTKISKAVIERIAEEIQPEKFAAWAARRNQVYFVQGFEIITLPLNKSGYFAKDSDDNLIFVNSKLPKAERTKVVYALIQKWRAKQAEVRNVK